MDELQKFHFNPFEPRDRRGEWTTGTHSAAKRPAPPPVIVSHKKPEEPFVQLFHGTTEEHATGIRQSGLHAHAYTALDPTLSPSKDDAGQLVYELSANARGFSAEHPGHVFEFHVPRSQEAEYLFPAANELGYRALRKPLPASMIHAETVAPLPYWMTAPGRINLKGAGMSYEEQLEARKRAIREGVVDRWVAEGAPAELIVKRFNPDEPRGPGGKWTSGAAKRFFRTARSKQTPADKKYYDD